MLVLYQASVKKLWQEEQEWRPILEALPAVEAARIKAYRSLPDQQLRLAGRCMLRSLLKVFGLEQHLSLEQLKYDPYHRPYFPGTSFQFSIAHSGSLVLCAATMEGSVGVDLELLGNAQPEFLQAYLTASEWEQVQSSPDCAVAGIRAWTRKEAVLKANGRGVMEDWAGMDASRSPVAYEGKRWHLQELHPALGYLGCLATSVPLKSVQAIPYSIPGNA